MLLMATGRPQMKMKSKMKKSLGITILIAVLSTAAGCSSTSTTETAEHPSYKSLNTISIAKTGKSSGELRVQLDELHRKAIENPSDIKAMDEFRSLQNMVVEIASEYAQQPVNTVVEEDDEMYELF